MLDNWGMLTGYWLNDVAGRTVMTKVQETNPLKAMMIGVNKTIYFIDQVYLMMQRMVVTRSVGLDQVSGPVGIVKMGSEIAEHDLVKLLYFLALISANLAVINFLPLPIVDGGLFVFLIVEKIKGSPISMKVQMATQVVGLALIVSIFLYVTFNDVLRIME
jgi:regulator of sigma E protease